MRPQHTGRRTTRSRARLAGLVASLLGAALLSVRPAAAQPAAEYRPGELLVGVPKGASPAATEAIHAQVGATVLTHWTRLGVDHVKLPPGLGLAEAVARYERLPGVRHASPNYVRRASGMPTTELDGAKTIRAAGRAGGRQASPDLLRHALAMPNDPEYDMQWEMPTIRAESAWNIQTGSRAVVLADLDTGADYNHGDLAANMWQNPGEIPGNGLDDDGNGYVDDVYGIDAVNGDSDPMDDSPSGRQHGTHSAGVMGAVGNNGLLVTGVNWQVQIMALKCLDYRGEGTDAEAITCLDYVATMKRDHNVNVVAANVSWADRGFGQALKEAFDACGDLGVVSCCAAGDGDPRGTDNDADPVYPASFDSPSIISVAASDWFGLPAYFTNRGRATVDLFAPGEAIASLMANHGDDDVYIRPGTSTAVPHVTGAAGLLAAAEGPMSAAAMKERLLAGADLLPQLAGLCVTGGRLDLLAVVDPYPMVMAVGLVPGTDGVSADTDVTVQFSRPMGPLTVQRAFSLWGAAGAVAGTWTWPSRCRGLFHPTTRLTWRTRYTGKLTVLAKSGTGKPLDGNANGRSDGAPTDNYSFSFKTGATPPPMVDLVAPRDDARIAGSAYPCAARATSDPAATLTSVRFEYSIATRTRTYSRTPGASVPLDWTAVPDTLLATAHTPVLGIRVYTDISIDPTHAFCLDVRLTSPSGRVVCLRDHHTDPPNPTVGWYPTDLAPVEPLDTLLGQDAYGRWTLTVRGGESYGIPGAATLNDWRLELITDAWRLIGTATAPEASGFWTVPWNTTTVGTHLCQVRALAADSFGSRGWGVSERVVVNQAQPQVSLIDPAEGATVAGRYLCRALATAPAGGAMRSVTFQRLSSVPSTLTRTPALAIPDYGGGPVSDTVVCPQTGPLSAIRVYLDVAHPRPHDLTIDVTSPGDATVRLHFQQPGNVPGGIVGTYRTEIVPYQSLDGLLGQSIGGTWTLTLEDHASGSEGVLNQWGLVLQTGWTNIGTASAPDASGFWRVIWPTTAVLDGPCMVRARAVTTASKVGTDTHAAVIDNAGAALGLSRR